MGTLTTRQEQIMNLVCQGLTNKEIGNALGIAERTVSSLLTTYPPFIGAFERLGARNRAEAAVKFTKLKYNLEV